jgi:glutamate carboxypeptidase
MAELVDTLRLLVEHESPTGATRELRDVLVRLLTGAGAAAETDGEHVVARIGAGAGPHVLVLGHFDTVWPIGALAERPFTVEDDRASGPGVFDMKGGLVSLLHALGLVRGRPSRPVRIVLTADEELGSPDGARVVAAQADGAAAVYALEPPLRGGTLKVGRRGVARVRLSVRGREAHAALNTAAGVSAIDELIDHLAALRRPGINVGTLAGGTRANVIAGAATAEVGLRFATPDDEAAIFALLERLAPIRDGASLQVEVLSRRPAWAPSASQALADHVRAVAHDLGETIGAAVSPGAGDANLTGALGIPTVDGLGPRGRGAHSRDETVLLSSIPARGALLARLLTE